MQKKHFSFFVVSLFFFVTSLQAQVTNYALNLNGTDKLSIHKEILSQGNVAFTLQAWINPSEWNNGAVVFSTFEGENGLTLSLGAANQLSIVCKNGTSQATATVTSPLLVAQKWQQITLVYDNAATDKIAFYIDGTPLTVVGVAAVPALMPLSTDGVVIGKGFKGRIDEMRVWSCALTAADFSLKQTVNKFNPNYAQLVAYWRFDHVECAQIVDEAGVYHAALTGATRVKVTDNANFKYRVVAGYAGMRRMIDRGNIDKDMYLMTNDLIVLSAKVFSNGDIQMEYPDNQGTLTNASYIANYKDRAGVASFNGTGSSMNIGTRTLIDLQTGIKKFTFEGWFCIDAWTEGAALLRKEKSATEKVCIKLGKETAKQLVVELNGLTYILENKLEVGKWQHIAVNVDATAGRLKGKVDFIINGSALTATTVPESGDFTEVPYLIETPTYLCENLNGKMDEVMIWNNNRNESSVKKDMTEGYKFPTGVWDDIMLQAYWKCDDADNLGKDYQSWTNMMEHMRNQYAGYQGMKVRFGLISADDSWKQMIANPAKLATFVANVKALLPYCDGVDIDFEWCYSQSEWDNYGNMVEKLRAVIPADKVFSCSLHAVSYKLAKKYIDMVDYFTFQIYGPSVDIYAWTRYVQAWNDFIRQGYPKEKILLSIGCLAVAPKTTPIGYSMVGDAHPNLDPDLDAATVKGVLRSFNGVTTVKRKQQFLIDNDALGTMYFDMGNDLKVSDKRSLIRAINDLIPSDVIPYITKVDLPSATNSIEEKEDFKLIQGDGAITICTNDEEGVSYQISNAAGIILQKGVVVSAQMTIQTADFQNGLYFVTLFTKANTITKKIIL